MILISKDSMTALAIDQTTFYEQKGQSTPIDIFAEDEPKALHAIFRDAENY